MGGGRNEILFTGLGGWGMEKPIRHCWVEVDFSSCFIGGVLGVDSNLFSRVREGRLQSRFVLTLVEVV